MQVSGVIAAGESTGAMAYIKARRGLSPRQAKLIMAVCPLAIGVPVGAWMSGSWEAAWTVTIYAVLGLMIAFFMIQLLSVPTLRRALAARGQSARHELTFSLTPDGVVYDLGEMTMTARWSCVTDLFRTPKYWVFLVQSSALVLPRRFFATPEAERAFIAEALSRMEPAAQARSPDARRVAA